MWDLPEEGHSACLPWRHGPAATFPEMKPSKPNENPQENSKSIDETSRNTHLTRDFSWKVPRICKEQGRNRNSRNAKKPDQEKPQISTKSRRGRERETERAYGWG
jgi:hypothetical protein